MEGEGGPSRIGWVRLPHGWERRQVGSRFLFYNHLTGKYQDTSPLADQLAASPQRMHYWRNLPSGWKKTCDNVGNAQFIFNQEKLKLDSPQDTDLGTLPSWVPDWTKWSSKNPEPFPSLVYEKPRYWASGKARNVTLKLTGVLFDKIESQARPWCPEPHLLPIDRSEITTLQEWESLATKSVPNCPYAKSGGRYNAYWRTHMADYAGSRRATEKENNYSETWANRGERDSRVQDHLHAPNERRWPTFDVSVGDIMSKMYVCMVEKGYVFVKGMKSRSECIADYKGLRKRIYSASVGRAMFVTSKGFKLGTLEGTAGRCSQRTLWGLYTLHFAQDNWGRKICIGRGSIRIWNQVIWRRLRWRRGQVKGF